MVGSKILSSVAKDILANTIFTIASEFAFIIGGCILDPFFSLSPKMVESLIWGKIGFVLLVLP